jgi:hypothetical protein
VPSEIFNLNGNYILSTDSPAWDKDTPRKVREFIYDDIKVKTAEAMWETFVPNDIQIRFVKDLF